MYRQSFKSILSVLISFQVGFGPASVALAQSAAAKPTEETSTFKKMLAPVKFQLTQRGTYDLYVLDLATKNYTRVNLGREVITSYNIYDINGVTYFKLKNKSSGKEREARIASLINVQGEARFTIVSRFMTKTGLPLPKLAAKFSPSAVIIVNEGPTYLVNRPLSQLEARLENLKLDLSKTSKSFVFSKALKTMARWSPHSERFVEKLRVKKIREALAPAETAQREALTEARLKAAAMVGPKFVYQRAVNASHTMITIIILSIIGIVKAKLDEARLQGKSLSVGETMTLIGETTLSTLDSPEIWQGMAFSGVTEGAFYYPNKIIAQIIANNVAKKMLAKILTSVVHSTISFVGWEAGGELWDEARDELETEEEQKIAAGFLSILAKSAVSKMAPNSGIGEKEKAVLKKMMANMGRILMNDDESRTYWFYNTWRKRIATGEFTTLITCMSVAGVIGTGVGPGPGTALGVVIGLGFGIAGGIAASYIPQPIKDGITMGFKVSREYWNSAALAVNEKILRIELDPEGKDRSIWKEKGLAGKWGGLLHKLDNFTIEKKAEATTFIDNLVSYLGLAYEGTHFGAQGAISAQYGMQNLFSGQYQDARYKENVERYTPSLMKELDERSNKRENLLTAYFEVVNLFKMRITQAEQENALAAQTLNEKATNASFANFVYLMDQKLKQALEDIPFVSINFFHSKSLETTIKENKELIFACTMGMKVFLKKIREFYPEEIKVMTDIEQANMTWDDSETLGSRKDNLVRLKEYTEFWVNKAADANFSQPVQQVAVGGMMMAQTADPNHLTMKPDLQNANRALQQADKYGFREEKVIKAMDEAMLDGIQIFGPEANSMVPEDGAPGMMDLAQAELLNGYIKEIETGKVSADNPLVTEEMRKFVQDHRGKPTTPEDQQAIQQMLNNQIVLFATRQSDSPAAPEDIEVEGQSPNN